MTATSDPFRDPPNNSTIARLPLRYGSAVRLAHVDLSGSVNARPDPPARPPPNGWGGQGDRAANGGYILKPPPRGRLGGVGD
jgi:hypothetical protein